MESTRTAECMASLLDMPAGCKLRVEELTGSPSIRSKLYAMGILPGTEVELCRQGCGKGSVCLRVRQSSLVLGESMAKSIFCSTAEEKPALTHRRHNHVRWVPDANLRQNHSEGERNNNPELQIPVVE